MPSEEPPRLRTLVSHGDSADLFDLTFLAEGYTAAEADAFYADAARLVDEVFVDRDGAFASQLPLFNIHALFVPSAETGLGAAPQPRPARASRCRARSSPRAGRTARRGARARARRRAATGSCCSRTTSCTAGSATTSRS